MKIEDGDFRVRLTKKMLIKAFLELRRQKPLRKITVSELCSAAGVGRGTFYAHFTDIYDLNEKLEDKFLADFSAALRGALQEKAGQQSTRRICRTVFALLEENEQLCQLLLAADNAGGAARFVELGGQLCAEYYRTAVGDVPNGRLLFPDGDVPTKQLADFYLFVSSGCISCLRERLRTEERPPVEQFADEMSEFINKGVRALLPSRPPV